MQPNSQPKHRIVIIAGPTGVGKTHYSLMLARQFDAEIVSADSMQVYKYLNIGTAKPTIEELGGVSYHLIDLVEPDEEFNLATYIKLADAKIQDISEQGKIPLIVGGTGLYIRGLIEGIFWQSSRDPKLRESLKKEAEQEGLDSLYQRLQQVDPPAAKKINPHDMVRIIRALEVYNLTGHRISALQRLGRSQASRYDYLLVVLSRERKNLYERINRRVDEMFGRGFVREVTGILARGYSDNSHCFKALGYSAIIDHVKGEISEEAVREKIQQETRRYAKRQLTWFRAMKNAVWVAVDKQTDEQQVVDILKKIVASFWNKEI